MGWALGRSPQTLSSPPPPITPTVVRSPHDGTPRSADAHALLLIRAKGRELSVQHHSRPSGLQPCGASAQGSIPAAQPEKDVGLRGRGRAPFGTDVGELRAASRVLEETLESHWCSKMLQAQYGRCHLATMALGPDGGGDFPKTPQAQCQVVLFFPPLQQVPKAPRPMCHLPGCTSC